MPKKDLEELFLESLEKYEIRHHGKIFSLGDTAFLADYIFGNFSVVVMEKHSKEKVEKIQKFVKEHSRYKIIVLTSKAASFIPDKCIVEIYDKASMAALMEKLKNLPTEEEIL